MHTNSNSNINSSNKKSNNSSFHNLNDSKNKNLNTSAGNKNSEINMQHNYSSKYMVITKNNIVFYNSKEEVLIDSKPLFILPLNEIELVDSCLIVNNNKINSSKYFMNTIEEIKENFKHEIHFSFIHKNIYNNKISGNNVQFIKGICCDSLLENMFINNVVIKSILNDTNDEFYSNILLLKKLLAENMRVFKANSEYKSILITMIVKYLLFINGKEIS